jgi:hypothetical protein
MLRERVQQLIRYHKIKHLFEKYERVFMPATLVFGVIVDAVTFRSIKIEITFVLLGIYFVLAGLSIVLLNLSQTDRVWFHVKFVQYARLVAPFVIQFTFGALLSASLIFYWFSGAISVSWPLVAIVVLLMVSNDVFRHYYQKPVVQISVYFFVLFSLLSLLFPFLFNSIGAAWFFMSGLVSLGLITVFVSILSRALEHIKQDQQHIFFSIALIFAIMNILYIFDVIPPIPLSLREAGVYHSVIRSGGGYTVLAEDDSILEHFIPGQTIHSDGSRRVFVFASIFAPTELNTMIVHEWNFYDESEQKWIVKDRLSYRISGGRDDGYRGYSAKSSVQPGRWRVDVQTQNGQTLGRIPFRVKRVGQEPALKKIQK